MGKGTNFDKEKLQLAADDLVRLKTILESSTSLKHISEASDIRSDVSGLEDSNGGWAYLAGQVSDVATTVSQYVQQLQQTAAAVHRAMEASIGTLTGADTDSRSTVNQSSPYGG